MHPRTGPCLFLKNISSRGLIFVKDSYHIDIGSSRSLVCIDLLGYPACETVTAQFLAVNVIVRTPKKDHFLQQ